MPSPKRRSPLIHLAAIIGMVWYAVTLALPANSFGTSIAFTVIARFLTEGQTAACLFALAGGLIGTRYWGAWWLHDAVQVLTIGAVTLFGLSLWVSAPGVVPGVGVYLGGAVALVMGLWGRREW